MSVKIINTNIIQLYKIKTFSTIKWSLNTMLYFSSLVILQKIYFNYLPITHNVDFIIHYHG